MGESLQLHFRKMMQAGDFLTDSQWLLYMVIIASSLIWAGVIPFKAVQWLLDHGNSLRKEMLHMQ